MSTQRQILKLCATVLQGLPDLSSEEMQGWIESPRELSIALRKALTALPFKVWRTIKLGTGLKTAGDFRRALADGEFGVSDWASDLIGQPVFEVATEETEIDLVVASVAELGFEQGARRDRIYARAKELGLEPCPAEVGPQLHLQYKNQPMGEWLLIAMEPIIDSDGRLEVFRVEHDEDGLWLHSNDGNPDGIWSPAHRWVFRLPRK